jgi:hypothetical protein
MLQAKQAASLESQVEPTQASIRCDEEKIDLASGQSGGFTRSW